MEYRRLGSTNIDVSRIGFGCWAIGGHGYGAVKDEESIEAIHRAIDMGINLFDTADAYGFGHSERILAKALGEYRHDVVIATKFGVAWDDAGHTYLDCSPKRATEALEGSLRRLKIDCIPIYQIHWYDDSTLIYDTMEVLERHKNEGKIRYVSCSNFSIDMIRDVMKTYRLESLQCLYNVIERENERDMHDCYENMKMGVMTYGSLGRGLLSGKYGLRNREFVSGDTRGSCDLFRDGEFEANLNVVEVLKEIGRKYGKSVSQVAIRFVLDQKFVTSALVGHKTAGQVSENIDSLDWNLSQVDMECIRSCRRKGGDSS